jgi:hypothetical protein
MQPMEDDNQRGQHGTEKGHVDNSHKSATLQLELRDFVRWAFKLTSLTKILRPIWRYRAAFGGCVHAQTVPGTG